MSGYKKMTPTLTRKWLVYCYCYYYYCCCCCYYYYYYYYYSRKWRNSGWMLRRCLVRCQVIKKWHQTQPGNG